MLSEILINPSSRRAEHPVRFTLFCDVAVEREGIRLSHRLVRRSIDLVQIIWLPLPEALDRAPKDCLFGLLPQTALQVLEGYPISCYCSAGSSLY